MKKFIVKILCVAAVVALILEYDSVTQARVAQEEAAKAEADAENALVAIINGEGTGLENGTYQATAQGYGGDVTIELTVALGKITSIEIISAELEDTAYLSMAEGIIDTIIAQQSADVDTITGATFSSSAIKTAAQDCLEQAQSE